MPAGTSLCAPQGHSAAWPHAPKTQSLPGLLGQSCFAKRNKAACGIRGMELLSLKAWAGAVWEGIVLPWVCTWAGFSPSPRSKGLMWSSDLVLCFGEHRSWVESFCSGSGKAISALMMLVPCPVSPGAGDCSFGWSLLVRGVRRKVGLVMASLDLT